MNWRLSYCTLDRSPLFGLPETLESQVRAAARAGFPLVTPDIFSLRAYRDTRGGSIASLKSVLDDVGMEAYDLSGVTITDDRETSLAELDEFLVFARELDATWIQSRLPVDTPVSRAIYAEAGKRVADSGFGFAFEYSPFVPICSLRAAAAFIGEMGAHAPRQHLIIDTWHFFRCGDTFDDLRSLDPTLFGYLQFDDALGAGPDMRFDTLNRRALPGRGELPMREFLSACDTQGFSGVLSVELMSEGLRTLAIDPYVEAIMTATRPFVA